MLVKLGDAQYKIEFDFNSMCIIEDYLGMTITEIMYNEQKIGFAAMRAFLAGGLAKHNPEIGLKETGELMQSYIKKGGNLENLLKRIFEQMEADGLTQNSNKGPHDREKKRHHGKPKQ